VNRGAPSGFGDDFRLTLLTDDPALALEADAAGVDRIGADLEHMGKATRQAGEDVRLSSHTAEDLQVVAKVLTCASAFVRINPLHQGSEREIETVLQAGAQAVMLPYFDGPREAEGFVRLLDGRAKALLLLETPASLIHAPEIFAVAGLDEAMMGLNDLRLALGLQSHFELLVSPKAALLAEQADQAGVPLSAGGVANPSDRGLAIPPDLVLAQYPRLGITGAWLSRSFAARTPRGGFGQGVAAIRRRLDEWAAAGAERLETARLRLAEAVGRL
jgi:citrate lyase beta subunit